MATVFLLPTILAQGSGLVKLDYFFSFLTLRFKLYTRGLSPFFLQKPFLTVGVGMKVCLVSLIAVCIYHYVITFGLRGKYDIDGHYFRFMARILANPHMTSHCYVRYTYCSCIVCKHLISSEFFDKFNTSLSCCFDSCCFIRGIYWHLFSRFLSSSPF